MSNQTLILEQPVLSRGNDFRVRFAIAEQGAAATGLSLSGYFATEVGGDAIVGSTVTWEEDDDQPGEYLGSLDSGAVDDLIDLELSHLWLACQALGDMLSWTRVPIQEHRIARPA